MAVETQRIGRTLVVSLQREAKRNAVDEELALGIDGALNELDDDPELWVGVITGTTSVFSAGTDLHASSGPATARGGEYGVIRRERVKPLIAAVEGPALGGGFEIVLACDLVVASTTASFGLPEVARGLVATCGGLFRSARALPLNVAKELLLTGDRLEPQRAYAIGLVNVVAEPGRAVEEALRLAERICANGPVAVRASLHALEESVTVHDDHGWDATTVATRTIAGSEDMHEGVRAFFERRAPQWKGR
jgi:enoyl-CoA hydratase